MSAGPWPMFWRNPVRYCRWAAHEKPFIFYSLVIGLAGPIFAVAKFPIDRYYGNMPPPAIPMTYPSMFGTLQLDSDKIKMLMKPTVPSGPRKELKGYGDS
jgi:hypothetical protein